MPATSPFDYGVYHFRRTFDLSAVTSTFLIHVTADNRYKLYVNGEFASLGPARGDLYHWRYESVDIARYLKPGKNVLAAVVWNFGEQAPEAQITNRTGLLVQGDSAVERIVDTGKQWKVHPRCRLFSCAARSRNVAILLRDRSGRSRGCQALSLGLGTARLRRFRLARRGLRECRRARAMRRMVPTAGCWFRAPSRPWN